MSTASKGGATGGASKNKGKSNEKFDKFRSLLRKAASDLSKSVPAYLHGLFDDKAHTSGKTEELMVACDVFVAEMKKLKDIGAEFSSSELEEVFNECDESARREVSIDDLAVVCTRTISRARADAMKLRMAIMQVASNETEYRREYSSIVVSNSKYADMEGFASYAEELLDKPISDADAIEIMGLFDVDGDGKVSCDDFVAFVLGRTAEAVNVLKTGDGEHIVDIRISASGAQEAELSKNGYTQILAEKGPTLFGASGGSFGKGESLWVWRRKQGTASGRLKPILDIQLNASAASSAMVLGGYTRVQGTVAGQYLWIKRATTAEEEERKAILDLFITLGKAKDKTDPINNPPDVRWKKVDGNFAKSNMMEFSKVDAFLWFLPAAMRTLDDLYYNPIRSAVALPDEARKERVILMVRTCIRHYVPHTHIATMSKANLHSTAAIKAESVVHTPGIYADYTALYHMFDRSGKSHLTKAKFGQLLQEVGCCIDPVDLNWAFYFFNVTLDSYITIEEFGDTVSLTENELDVCLDKIRSRLLRSSSSSASSADNNNKSDAASGDSAAGSGVGQAGAGAVVTTKPNKLRDNRLLSQVFTIINTSGSGILSVEELQAFAATIELFITEQEGRRMLASMDVGNDEKVQENDFVEFMKRKDDVLKKQGQRLRAAATKIRSWLQRGQAGAGVTAQNTLQNQWNELKTRRERFDTSAGKFSGYLTSEDLLLLCVERGIPRLSAQEARQLCFLIAPDKLGKVSMSDLQGFMGRSCRMFGELEDVLSRDVMRVMVDTYNAYRSNYRTTGTEDPTLRDKYDRLFRDVLRQVQGTYVSAVASSAAPDAASPTGDQSGGGGGSGAAGGAVAGGAGKHNHEVISVMQLKAGIETAMRIHDRDAAPVLSRVSGGVSGAASPTSPVTNTLLNLEEWALYCCRLGCCVCEEERYGVRVRQFLQNFVESVCGGLEDNTEDEVLSLESLRIDLQRMIVDEARSAAANAGNTSKAGPARQRASAGGSSANVKDGLDFVAAFNLFDSDGNGAINLDEFRRTLYRLKLVDNLPEAQIPQLLAMFDKTKKGYINLEDFVRFATENNPDPAVRAFAPAGSKGSKKPSGAADPDDPDFDNFESDDEDNAGSNDKSDSTVRPPATITRNADCDYLCWCIYKEAVKTEPADPEGVISELEQACGEADITSNNSITRGTVTAKELWNLMFEFKLRGSISKEQFEKGIVFVTDTYNDSNVSKDKKFDSNDGGNVNYESLCRFIVRMGRAYNQKVQEKQKANAAAFEKLLNGLMKELGEILKEVESQESKLKGKKDTQCRTEKVLRRLDEDNDGIVGISEFKQTLKRLRTKDCNNWSTDICKLFFARINPKLGAGSNPRVNISELIGFVRDWTMSSSKGVQSSSDPVKGLSAGTTKAGATLGKGKGGGNLSDDEEADAGIFARNNALSDYQLIKKVVETLFNSISDNNGANMSGTMQTHTVDNVKTAIRKFFSRSDPDGKGVVSEERFRAFVRRSGLQENLTTSELRRLIEKLKRARTVGGPQSATNVTMIDYERLCRMLTHSFGNNESFGHSKAEAILLRIQEAYLTSAQAFSNTQKLVHMCSMIDTRGHGTVTIEELCTCLKMICGGETITPADIICVADVLAETTINVGEHTVNYHEFQVVLETFVPSSRQLQQQQQLQGGGLMNNTNPWGNAMAMSMMPDSPFRASGGVGVGGAGVGVGMNRLSLVNPAAIGIGAGNNRGSFELGSPMRPNVNTSANANPFSRSANNVRPPLGAGAGMAPGGIAAGGAADRFYGRQHFHDSDTLYRVLRSVGDRVRAVVEERSRALGMGFQLRRVFEACDAQGTGLISIRALQGCLEDIGVPINATDIYAIRSTFGRPQDEMIDYAGFCVELLDPNMNNYNLQAGRTLNASTSGLALGDGVDNAGDVVSNPRVVERFRELQRAGVNVFGEFGMHDTHNTGLIDVRKFKQIVQQLQLLQTGYQLQKCVENFGSLADRNDINYEDFVTALEAQAKRDANNFAVTQSNTFGGTRHRRHHHHNRDRDEDRLDRQQDRDRWFSANNRYYNDSNSMESSVESSPRGGLNSDRGDVFDKFRSSLHGFTDQQSQQQQRGGYVPDSFLRGSLSPPKVTDSTSFYSRQQQQRPSSAASNTAGGGGYSSPVRGGASTNRTNSLAGSTMTTPVAGRRGATSGASSTWMCPVCFYENHSNSNKCGICDSVDHNRNPEFQLKVTCPGCRYENGQFATECEMCHRSLRSNASAAAATNKSNPFSSTTAATVGGARRF